MDVISFVCYKAPLCVEIFYHCSQEYSTWSASMTIPGEKKPWCMAMDARALRLM
jgi:hypothetical protein